MGQTQQVAFNCIWKLKYRFDGNPIAKTSKYSIVFVSNHYPVSNTEGYAIQAKRHTLLISKGSTFSGRVPSRLKKSYQLFH